MLDGLTMFHRRIGDELATVIHRMYNHYARMDDICYVMILSPGPPSKDEEKNQKLLNNNMTKAHTYGKKYHDNNISILSICSI
jgi:hypothetical protein